MTRSTLAIPQTISSSKRSGFTLTEILTVVTIVVILLGILIPSILSVQRKAKRVESEALFGKLITAFTLYRKDHGTYPDLSGSLKDGDVVIDLNNPDQWSRFAEIMALSNNDGSALENPENKTLIKSFNPKLKRYFDLQLSELEKVSGADRLVDAFGNPHIYVVVDANLDGKIGRSSLPDSEPKDLRQRIVVYTVDENDDDFLEMKSWDS